MKVQSARSLSAVATTDFFARAFGGAPFTVTLFTLRLQSGIAPCFIDITDQVNEFLHRAEVRSGLAVVFSKHTTAGITIQEHEPLLLQDMADFLKGLSPPGKSYRHDDLSVRTVNLTEDEQPNGHSHCQHLVLGASQTIPVVNGRLSLGQWERIFLVEVDRPREREVLVQVLGI